MRDCWEFLRGLLTLGDNPYFLRWLRKDLRSGRVLRNHIVGLCATCGLAYISLLLGGWIGHLLDTSMLPLGEIPRTELMALSVIGIHSWMAMIAVSFRAGQCIEHEYRIRSLDMVRVTGLDGMRLMGMKTTYPLVFGLVMLLPALPLYLILVGSGSISARDLIGLFVVIAIISVRPAGASIIGGSVNVGALDEWKRRVIMAVVGVIVAVQFFFFGFTLYRIPTFLGSASQTILLPAAWARIAAEGIFTLRPFYEISMPFIVPALILLPLFWPAIAATAFERVVEGVPKLRVRANPSWHWATIGAAVVIPGFAWESLLGPTGMARVTGAIAGDTASVLAGLWPVLIAAWTLPTAWMLVFTGGSNMGLLPCGGERRSARRPADADDTATEEPNGAQPVMLTLSEVTRDLVGAVSVLAWPMVAFVLCCLVAWRVPTVGSAFSLSTLVAAMGTLIYCYGLGRWFTLASIGVRTTKRVVLSFVALACLVALLAILGTTNLGPMWTILSPLTGAVVSLSGVREALTGLAWTQAWMPDALTCGLVHAMLGCALLLAYSAMAAGSAKQQMAPAERIAVGPARPIAALLAEDEARHRWVRDPLFLRLLRSNRTTIIQRMMRIVPIALGLSAVLFTLIMPEQIGLALRDIDLIPDGLAGPNPCVGAFAVTVALCTAVLSIGAFSTGAESLRAERDQGTAGQLLLTQLSSSAIGLGYQKPVWRSVAETALLLLPFAVGALCAGFSSDNLNVVIALYALLLIDPIFSAAWGGVIGACVDRPWLSGVWKTLFIGQRAIVLMSFFVFMGDRLLGGRTGELLLGHPVFLGLLALELVATLISLRIIVATVHRFRRESIESAFGGDA